MLVKLLVCQLKFAVLTKTSKRDREKDFGFWFQGSMVLIPCALEKLRWRSLWRCMFISWQTGSKEREMQKWTWASYGYRDTHTHPETHLPHLGPRCHIPAPPNDAIIFQIHQRMNPFIGSEYSISNQLWKSSPHPANIHIHTLRQSLASLISWTFLFLF